jgi:hypothetical protein
MNKLIPYDEVEKFEKNYFPLPTNVKKYITSIDGLYSKKGKMNFIKRLSKYALKDYEYKWPPSPKYLYCRKFPWISDIAFSMCVGSTDSKFDRNEIKENIMNDPKFRLQMTKEHGIDFEDIDECIEDITNMLGTPSSPFMFTPYQWKHFIDIEVGDPTLKWYDIFDIWQGAYVLSNGGCDEVNILVLNGKFSGNVFMFNYTSGNPLINLGPFESY